jgi:hypothetical protein
MAWDRWHDFQIFSPKNGEKYDLKQNFEENHNFFAENRQKMFKLCRMASYNASVVKFLNVTSSLERFL